MRKYQNIVRLMVFSLILISTNVNAGQPLRINPDEFSGLIGGFDGDLNFNASIVQQLEACGGLPCTFSLGEWTVTVAGEVLQKKTGLRNVELDTTVLINGMLLGSVTCAVDPGPEEVYLEGIVNRADANVFDLPSLEYPINLNVGGVLETGIPLPEIKIVDAVKITMWFLLMDVDASKSMPSEIEGPRCKDGEENCDDIIYEYDNELGCDGPMTGLGVFPVPSSDETEKCCVEHDLCYQFGGPAEQREKCDQKLSDCVNDTISMGSVVYSNIVLKVISWVGGFAFAENDEDCRCSWAPDDETVDFLFSLDGYTRRVANYLCCEKKHGNGGTECQDRGCAIGIKNSSGDVFMFNGECSPADAGYPPPPRECNHNGIKDPWEECDGSNAECGPSEFCTPFCICAPATGGVSTEVPARTTGMFILD